MIQHRPRKFSVIIVPEKDSHIRRFDCSRRTLNIALSALAVFLLTVVSCVFTMMHYYRAYESTEEARIRAARFERERSDLIGKVASLEDALARTQRFAMKLESLAGAKEGREASLGPLEGHFRSIREALDQEANGGVAWQPPVLTLSTDEMETKIDLMKTRTAEIEKLLHAVFSEQQDKLFFWASIPALWPTRGFVTSQFGAHRGYRMHEGLDIAGGVGTPIVAPGDGIVTFTGYKGGYGNMLKIDHGYGVVTHYGHCSKIFVQEGDRVKRGSIVAAVGNTGSSTGPHLHYEVYMDGVPVNPLRYLAKR